MGKAFAKYTDARTVVCAVVITLLLILPFGLPAVAALVVSILFTAFFANFVTKKLGGLTGDVYGAITTLNEGLVLLSFLVSTAVLR